MDWVEASVVVVVDCVYWIAMNVSEVSMVFLARGAVPSTCWGLFIAVLRFSLVIVGGGKWKELVHGCV